MICLRRADVRSENSENGRQVNEIEHRGHQIESFDSKVNIPRSKYSRKAEKTSKMAIQKITKNIKIRPDPTGYLYIYI